MKSLLYVCFGGLLATNVLANPVVVGSNHTTELPCGVHTQMEMTSLGGSWTTQVQFIGEIGIALLPNDDCTVITEKAVSTTGKTVQQIESFVVNKGETLTAAQKLVAGEDFYALILVTMTEKKPSASKQLSANGDGVFILSKDQEESESTPPPKSCAFFIGASGPAVPVQKAASYNGAVCDIKVDVPTFTYRMTAQ